MRRAARRKTFGVERVSFEAGAKQYTSTPKQLAVMVAQGFEMNGASDSKTIQAPAQQAPAKWLNYVIFTLCASLYLVPFMRIIFAGTDEGTFLYGAVRITHGQVFARDFFEVMGPGTFYWLAAFFKLFGSTFLTSRICLFISSLGTALTIYILSRRVCDQYQTLPCLIVAGTYMGVLWPGISHHVDSNFFALLSFFCMVLWNTRHKNSLLIAAGLLAGVTTWILQPKGVFLFFAFLAGLWLQRRKTPKPLAVAGLLTGSYLAVSAIVLIYFWSQGALNSLLYANLLWPSQHYAGGNSVVYAFNILRNYWIPWVSGFGGSGWAVAIAVILITPFMFVAALPALMVIIGIKYKWKTITPEITLYWLCGWAFWLSEFHRKDIEHLVFGSTLLVILCVHALTRSHGRLAKISVQILAISAVCLAGFNCCFALVAGAHVSTTRVGRIAILGQESVLKFLNEHVSPGEDILIYPYAPTYYFLSATTNPTRYSLLMYNYNTRAQFQEVVQCLEQRKVKYVIWDTTFPARASHNFPGLQPSNPSDLIIEPYLESHYKLVEDLNGIHIMERE